MDIGYAIVKGIVQGLAEFLPISSTAHLVFADALANALGMQLPSHEEQEFFNILVQVGTLGAVVYYFKRELYATTLLAFGRTPDTSLPHGYAEKINLRQLPLHLFISVTATVIFTFGLLKLSEVLFSHYGWHPRGAADISEFFFRYSPFVAVHLVFTGFLLFVSQKLADRRVDQGQAVDNKSAAVIGIFQGVSAIFHGVSRSGSTISAGLLTGLDRVTATRYSFLLSLPTFILATIYEVIKFSGNGVLVHFNWTALIVGTLVSAVVGYFCIKYFILFLAKNRLTPFAVYCWVVGGLMLVFMLSNG